jgi:hypothetical protein
MCAGRKRGWWNFGSQAHRKLSVMRGQPGPAEGRPDRKLDPRILDALQPSKTLPTLSPLRVIMDGRDKPGHDLWIKILTLIL